MSVVWLAIIAYGKIWVNPQIILMDTVHCKIPSAGHHCQSCTKVFQHCHRPLYSPCRSSLPIQKERRREDQKRHLHYLHQSPHILILIKASTTVHSMNDANLNHQRFWPNHETYCSVLSKWELPCLPPSSLELWRRERASKQLSFWWKTLILLGHYGILWW